MFVGRGVGAFVISLSGNRIPRDCVIALSEAIVSRSVRGTGCASALLLTLSLDKLGSP